MTKIALLSEQLINQIAAGEVVERPASVIKELVENSIDAGANKIVVELKGGGLEMMKIIDNGCGMSKEDALMSIQRHATSKIRTMEDLLSVSSMGFRGEALASIASVSKFILKTRGQENEGGVKLELEGGNLTKEEAIGMQIGTEIEVNNLFFNTPARLKFMKTVQTEYQNIVDVLLNLALIHPQISFKLINYENIQTGEIIEIENVIDDPRVVFDLPATADNLVRLRSALGKAISDNLIEVFYEGVNLKIRGFIGKPELSRASKSMQYFFVNGRPINSHVLSYAIKQAYHSLLPKERYPVFVINFEIDPSLVDVNCHPRKMEVKFKDEREVFRVLTSSCAKALEKNVLIPKINQENRNYYQEKSLQGLGSQNESTLEFQALSSGNKVTVDIPNYQYSNSNHHTPNFSNASSLQDGNSSILQNNIPLTGQINQIPVAHTASATHTTSAGSVAMDFAENLVVLAQLNNSFILCQKGADLAIIDQHAAHERIRYNKLMEESENEENMIQPLLVPVNIELSPSDIAVLNSNKTALDEVGLKLEHFGGNTFAISEVPAFLAKNNLENLLLGLIDDLRKINDGSIQTHKGDLFTRKEKILTYMACRSAVKFGDKLSHQEMVELINQIENTTFGKATCPHGRPIMVILEASELWSRFGRKYTGFFENEQFRGINC